MSKSKAVMDQVEEAEAMVKLERAAARREPARTALRPAFDAPVETLIAQAQAYRGRWAPKVSPREPSEPEWLLNVPGKHAWCLKAGSAELATGCDPSAIQKALEGAKQGLHCVMISGPQRGGKSNLATWLAAMACKRRKKPGFWIKAETLGGIWACRNGEPPEFTRALRVPVLVLDDIGTESRNEETRAMITRLLTEREAETRLVTIVTHGLVYAPGEINARYGAGVSGRYGDPSTSLCIDVDNAWNPLKAKAQSDK